MAPRISFRGFSHAGFVKIDEEFHACSVTNMSFTGATLHLPPWTQLDLPEAFVLQLTRDGAIERACTLIWQEGDEAGVLFNAAA